MRTFQDTEEEERADTEITLGVKSLLGVFFGLVLICAVFFGLGYSLGRGSVSVTKASSGPQNTSNAAPPKATTPPPVAPLPNENEDDTTETKTYTPGPDAREPLKTSTTPATATSKPSATVIKQVAPESEENASVSPKPAPVIAPPAAQPSNSGTIAATPPSTSPQATAQSAPVMVQVAAISRQEDADVLVAALKKRGYSAVVRNDPKDNLLHVQIGPFATRDEARAMRAKLLADGYNAILK